MNRVALYARVSTSNGHQDPEMQLREQREFCSRRGWTVTKEYIDLGVSGAKASRPALNELMAEAAQRKFDAVLIWELDRFTRSLKHLANALAEFEALDVAFVSLRDAVSFGLDFCLCPACRRTITPGLTAKGKPAKCRECSQKASARRKP